jgi:hypothetical protein
MPKKVYPNQLSAKKAMDEKYGLRKKILKTYEDEEGHKLNSKDIDNIAGLNLEDIKNVNMIMQDSLIAMGDYKTKKTTPKFESDFAVGQKVYSNLHNNGYLNFFMGDTSTLVKNESGTELMNKTIKQVINNNRTTRRDMMDLNELSTAASNFENILDKGGQIVSFDTETLGGTNAKGHQQVDFITEISALVRDVKAGGESKINEEKSMSTLFGFSKDEYDNIYSHLTKLKERKPGELSGVDSLYIHRLSLLADPNFAYDQKGFEVHVTGTSNPDELVDSLDNAFEGLKRYREIGEKQEQYLKGLGQDLVSYKNDYINRAKEMIMNGAGLDKNYMSLGYNSYSYDNPAIGQILGQSATPQYGRHLDPYQMIKYNQEHFGIGTHIPKGKHTTSKFGPTSQDQLKHMFELDKGNVAAHNAKEDADTLYKIMTTVVDQNGNKNYFDMLNSQLSAVSNKLKNLSHSGIELNNNDGKALFLMDKTLQKDYGINKNGLSFSYNPYDKSITTFDGFRIHEDGKVTKENINGYGPKKGALYTHEVNEVNISDKQAWRNQLTNLGLPEEQIEKYYQQYAGLDKLYVLKSTEFQNKKKLAQKFGENSAAENPNTYISILTSESQVASATGTYIGRGNGYGTIKLDDNAVKDLDFKTVVKDETGNIAIKSVDNLDEVKNMLLDRSMIRTSVESASRTIRDMPYERLMKVHKFASHNGQKRISDIISQLVLSNGTADMKTTSKLMNKLTQNLGYKGDLRGETLAKTEVIDDYAKVISPILDAIEGNFKDLGLTNIGKNNKALKAKRQYIFENTLTNILEDITTNPDVLTGAKPSIFSADELNRVDFVRNDLFPSVEEGMDGYTSFNSNNRFVSLDLSSDNGLLNMFYGNDFKDIDELKDGNVGFTSLMNAYEAISQDERFAGAFGDLNYEKIKAYQNRNNLSELNHVMTSRLKNFVSKQREEQSGFGLLYTRNIQDYSNMKNLGNLINNNLPMIQDNVKNYVNSYNADFFMANGKDKNLVDKFVDNYFMTFSKDDLENQIAGFTDNQQKWMRAQYGFSKQEARNTVSELLDSIKGTHLNLGVIGTGKDAQMFLHDGTKRTFVDMHKYVLNNGIIDFNIGGLDHSTHFSFNVNDIIRNGKINENMAPNEILQNIRISSNVQEALEKTSKFGTSVSYARRNGESIQDALVYNMKSKMRVLREVGPRKEHENFANNIKRAMMFNVNPIIGVLPELENDLINPLEKQYNVHADISSDFKKLLNKIRSGKVRPDDIHELLASEQNLFYHQYLNPLMQMLSSHADFGTANNGEVNLNEIIKAINPHSQDTDLAAGYMTVDDTPYEHGIAKFDKTGRSVSIQTENKILYSKKQLEEDIKKFGINKEVSVGGKLFSSSGAKFNNSKDFASGLTLKYMQIDSDSFKDLFVKDVEKVRNGDTNNRFSKFLESKFRDKIDLQKASTILAEKSMTLSTYQQQSVMDARVHYAAFHKNNEQIINGKKQLIVEHTKNLEVIHATMNSKDLDLEFDPVTGEVKYKLGYEVKRNQILGMFGSEGNIERSRYEGVFRGRYFDKNGNLVSETDLNKTLRSLNIKDKKAALSELNNIYKFKYQVIKKYDDFGHKIANDASEKSTVDSMDVAFGTIDTELADIFEKKGFKGLRGRYLSRDYIEQYITPNLSKDEQHLINRMLDERFSFSDALQYGWKELKGVHQYASLESPKHESISMAATNIVERIRRDKNLSKNAEEHYKAVFGDQLKIDSNGNLITDKVKTINTKVDNKDLQKILEDDSFVKDKHGNIIGHTGYSYVSQLYDYEGGTYSSNLDITKLKNKREIITKEISDLQDRLLIVSDQKRTKKTNNYINNEINQITSKLSNLTSQKQSIDKQVSSIIDQKGLKFDDRANLNLGMAVYNNDSMGLAYSNFLDKKEFNEYFGHALNKDGKISKEYLGKSVLDPVLSDMRAASLIGFGETKLGSVKGLEKKRYGYLLDNFKDIKNNISVEKAEKLYSYMQGVKAIDFNTVSDKHPFSQAKYDALVNGSDVNKFHELDLSSLKPNDKGWLSLDIGGQGNTITSAENNPYTKNVMIKTGLGGHEDYLAIARMPERHFEDNLIKTSHIKKLNQLQKSLKSINSGKLGNEELIAEKDKARRIVQDIKTSQIHDVTSKYGLAGDLQSVRLSQSYFGKASSITYNYDKAFGENSYNELKRLNSSTFLDTAKLGDKTLLQHYAEGKAVDAVAGSYEAFESMGYFSDDMIKSVFGHNGTKEQMIEHLKTNGDTFLATRFPRNQEGSDKVVLGYLDPTLKGNQLKAVGHTGASMKMDHDGDEFFIGRITDKNGKSYMNYVASGEDNAFTKSQKATLMERAVNDNRYWDSTIRNRVRKVERDIAQSGSSIQTMANKRIIDNKIYSAIMNSSKSNKYEDILHDDFYRDLVDKAINYKAKAGEKWDAHSQNLQTINETFSKVEDQAKATDKYINAYRYQMYKDEFIAKSSKNAIGESNVTNSKVKKILLNSLDKTAEDYNYKSSLITNMMYLTEEAAISAKSSVKGLDPNRANIWNSNLKDLILNVGDKEEHVNNLKNWTKKYVIDDLDYNSFWHTSNVFRGVAADTFNNGKSLSKEAFDTLISNKENKSKLQNRLTNDMVDTLSQLRDVKNVRAAFKYSSVGQSTIGVKDGIKNPVLYDGIENVSDVATKAMMQTSPELNSVMNFVNVNDTLKSTKSGGPNIIDNIVSGGTEEAVEDKSTLRNIVEGAKDLFKAASGSKIAMGAIGIAAGVMMLGYVGGRPRPADTQAMEEAQDYQEPQQGGLMDPSLAPMPVGGQQQGYVVNINARSDKGKKHAISAIQQAISNGTSSSVNINMNINDNYGNISDRDIQKAIKDAL